MKNYHRFNSHVMNWVWSCRRKAGANLPAKKLVPARVVAAKTSVADVKSSPADKTTKSPDSTADSVASAAVAAVVATHTYMKVSFLFACLSCLSWLHSISRMLKVY